MDARTLSTKLKSIAHRMGASHCGISNAEQLSAEALRLEQWLKKGHQGSMHYMERNFDVRIDPRKLMDGAKTVISMLFNYYTPEPYAYPKISRYARGDDYHEYLRQTLSKIVELWKLEIGNFQGRICVDSAPIMEKAWAQRSGLGWMGKNTNIIRKGYGSYFFLTEIVTDLLAAPDAAGPDFCGSCTACIDACPTGALDEAYTLDAHKCISYLTIELRDSIPKEFQSKMEGWMFGCDICQEVCPWNRFSKTTPISAFQMSEPLLNMKIEDWMGLTESTFKVIFKKSALKRAKYSGIIKNLKFISTA